MPIWMRIYKAGSVSMGIANGDPAIGADRDILGVSRLLIMRGELPMHVARRTAIHSIIVGFVVLALTACTTRLLPSYDSATYQNLSSLNANALILFSSLSADGSTKDFPRYQDQYNELIGGFGAARMALASRPIPALG